jgi:hypothetical protein
MIEKDLTPPNSHVDTIETMQYGLAKSVSRAIEVMEGNLALIDNTLSDQDSERLANTARGLYRSADSLIYFAERTLRHAVSEPLVVGEVTEEVLPSVETEALLAILVNAGRTMTIEDVMMAGYGADVSDNTATRKRYCKEVLAALCKAGKVIPTGYARSRRYYARGALKKQ